MSLEATLESKCTKQARDRGWQTVKLKQRGQPDRLFYRGPVYFLVEFKRPRGGALASHQRRLIERLTEQGVPVHVVRNRDHFETILAQAEERLAALSAGVHHPDI